MELRPGKPFWPPTSWEIRITGTFSFLEILITKLVLSLFIYFHCILTKPIRSAINLIDDASRNTSDNVSNEEKAGDPTAEEEVDLNRVAGSRPVHHLGDRDAGEGQPSTHN